MLQLAFVREMTLRWDNFFKMLLDFALLSDGKKVNHPGRLRRRIRTHLIGGHTVLDEKRYARVEVADIPLEDEVLLGLRRDLGLELSQYLLGCGQLASAE